MWPCLLLSIFSISLSLIHCVVFLNVVAGVLLAVLEQIEIIQPIVGPDGTPTTNTGTVSAGYQNFLVTLVLNCNSVHTI